MTSDLVQQLGHDRLPVLVAEHALEPAVGSERLGLAAGNGVCGLALAACSNEKPKHWIVA